MHRRRCPRLPRIEKHVLHYLLPEIERSIISLMDMFIVRIV